VLRVSALSWTGSATRDMPQCTGILLIIKNYLYDVLSLFTAVRTILWVGRHFSKSQKFTLRMIECLACVLHLPNASDQFIVKMPNSLPPADDADIPVVDPNRFRYAAMALRREALADRTQRMYYLQSRSLRCLLATAICQRTCAAPCENEGIECKKTTAVSGPMTT
jgi:hypothetical protein